jgi:predicted transcriptional regulator
MNPLRIGIASYEEMKERTMAIARGELKPGDDEPKLWFTSIESLARVLSDKNRPPLKSIADRYRKRAD